MTTSKTRRFWIDVGLALILVVSAGIALRLYLTLQPHPDLVQITRSHSATIINKQFIPRSYLIDVKTADDEPTRAAVDTTLKTLLTVEPRKDHCTFERYRCQLHYFSCDFISHIQRIQFECQQSRCAKSQSSR